MAYLIISLIIKKRQNNNSGCVLPLLNMIVS